MRDLEKSAWIKIIETIDSPLGFYVLALLIVEASLAVILTVSKIPPEQVFNGLLVGAGLFCLVVGMVFVLVFFKPENITFDKVSHLRRDEFRYGSGKKNIESISHEETMTTPPPTEGQE